MHDIVSGRGGGHVRLEGRGVDVELKCRGEDGYIFADEAAYRISQPAFSPEFRSRVAEKQSADHFIIACLCSGMMGSVERKIKEALKPSR